MNLKGLSRNIKGNMWKNHHHPIYNPRLVEQLVDLDVGTVFDDEVDGADVTKWLASSGFFGLPNGNKLMM